MNCNHISLAALISRLRHSLAAREVACAHNFMFEERVPAVRQAKYESGLTLDASATLDACRNTHRDYLNRSIQVFGRVPDTFGHDNAEAALDGLDDAQYVLRLENIGRPLAMQGTNLAQLAEQVQLLGGKAGAIRDNAESFLENFCRQWADISDERPVFACFEDELRDDISGADWAERLRARLGLSHYDVLPGGAGSDLALMRYRVRDVIR